MRPTPADIEEQNRYRLLRRAQFRRTAERVAEAFAEDPAVERVTLFGSVAKAPWKEVPRFRAYRRSCVEVWHECKDVDLAVWLNRLDGLGPLRKTLVCTLTDLYQGEQIGVAGHEVEVFVLEPGTDRYLGRLCAFNRCPKGKRACLVPGCGTPRYLRQFEDFTFYPDALDTSVVLYDRNERHPS